MASCELDCKAIHESWGRLSTLVRILATRTTQIQRREIRETYKAMYGEDLLSHLQRLKKDILGNKESKFSYKACEALFLWMSEPWERDAFLAKDALEGNEIDYNALVEIFVAKKSSHVLMVKQAYQTKYKRQLDQDIICLEPPHPCQKILVALSTSHKADDGDQVSQDIAKCDAIRLYQNGEGTSSSINEPFILEILSKRSISHLKLTFSSYKRIYGHNYTKQLKKESCTQFEDALRNLVECIQNPPKYYAKVLQRSIKGGNMKRDYLTRLIVSRAAIDMEEIQKILSKKYKIELRDALCQLIPKGDYRDFMLALIGVT